MAINSVRTALQLLSGAGELTRAKALEAAGTLLELPGVGPTSARAGQLAEELIEAATANHAMITDLVRTELDRRLLVLGLARGSDLETAQRKIDVLEAQVAALRAGATQSATSEASEVPRARASRSSTKSTATRRARSGSGAAADSADTASKALKSASTEATTKAARKSSKQASAATAKKTAPKKTAPKRAAPKKAATPKAGAAKRTSETAATKKTTARTQ